MSTIYGQQSQVLRHLVHNTQSWQIRLHDHLPSRGLIRRLGPPCNYPIQLVLLARCSDVSAVSFHFISWSCAFVSMPYSPARRSSGPRWSFGWAIYNWLESTCHRRFDSIGGLYCVWGARRWHQQASHVSHMHYKSILRARSKPRFWFSVVKTEVMGEHTYCGFALVKHSCLCCKEMHRNMTCRCT